MPYTPPRPQPNLLEKREMMKEVIKKVMIDDPELLNEIISELRKDKLKKIQDKINVL
jgi:nitrate reductase assembly molybdenum cofactor insertion protein NarJ